VPGGASRWILKHLATALAFSVGYVVLLSALMAGEVSVQTGEILTFASVFRKMAIHYVLLNLIMYWILVFGHMGWSYYRRYQERELQASELHRELVEARLSALRMQLNPHFLFNTLHAISSLIHENPEGADRMVARLSDLLRLSLDTSKPPEVPLREELAFLDRYLDIERTRFADRLIICKDVAPETENSLVPCLILQPLVENAIRHGIEPRDSRGELLISARRSNGRLELCVRDNGAGIQCGEGKNVREGIGLSNTRSRLRHMYGDDATLALTNAPAGGLEARIEIPFRSQSPARAYGD